MFKIAIPMFLKIETPLHVGSGQDLGVVDLPIQREKHTNYPKIEASGIKGSIREVFEEMAESLALRIFEEEEKSQEALQQLYFKVLSNKNRCLFEKKVPSLMEKICNEIKSIKEESESDDGGRKKQKESIKKVKEYIVHPLFGPEENGDFAGALGFSDARILLFPVRSVKGVFAYITCPYVLRRLCKDLEMSISSLNTVNNEVYIDIKENIKNLTDVISDVDVNEEKCITSSDSLLHIEVGKKEKMVVLEEYTFKVIESKDMLLNSIVNISGLEESESNRLMIVSDNDFRDFVTLSTEVITRTKIDNNTGTVKSGALFTEEYLPSEAVMYALVFASPIFGNGKRKEIFRDETSIKEAENVMSLFIDIMPKLVQMGGNATLGKGLICVEFPSNQIRKNQPE